MKVALIAAAGAIALRQSSRSEGSNQTPVQRVVKLLQDMSAQLDEEKKKDEEIFDKLDCWCKTNKKEKDAAVAEANTQEENLEAAMKEFSGKKGQYESEIKIKQKEKTDLENDLEQAEAIHEKEMEKMKAEEVDLINSITQLEMAMKVLEKHHKGFIQMTPELSAAVSSVVHHGSAYVRALTGKSVTVKQSFLQASTGAEALWLKSLRENYVPVLSAPEAARFLESFLATRGHTKNPHVSKYSTSSSQIWGILEEMEVDMKDDLKKAKKGMADTIASYKEFKASKSNELAAAREAYDTAKKNFADASKGLAESTELLEKTSNAKNADIEFLKNLRLQCQNIDQEWELRQKERADEQAAVAEAIEILTEDDAREALVKGMDTAFLQLSSHRESARNKISKMLMKASREAPTWADVSFDIMGQNSQVAKPVNSFKVNPSKNLAQIAMRVKLDSFEKVKGMINKMVQDITAQMKVDVDTRKQCQEDLHSNKMETKETKYAKKESESTIANLEAEMKALADSIEANNKQIKETQLATNEAGVDREKSNAAFQQTVQEQRATQEILHKAMARLNQYYQGVASKKTDMAGNAIDSFVQQTPPVRFETYKKSGGAMPVINMLEKVIADSKKLESESLTDEQTSQKEYETFVKDSNAAIKALNEENAANANLRGEKGEAKAQEEATLAGLKTSFENLSNLKTTLHNSCDFVLQNFEARATAMQNEIDALNQAKAILSGMGSQ